MGFAALALLWEKRTRFPRDQNEEEYLRSQTNEGRRFLRPLGYIEKILHTSTLSSPQGQYLFLHVREEFGRRKSISGEEKGGPGDLPVRGPAFSTVLCARSRKNLKGAGHQFCHAEGKGTSAPLSAEGKGPPSSWMPSRKRRKKGNGKDTPLFS